MNNLVQPLLKLLRPFAGYGFIGTNFDGHASRLLGIILIRREMHIVFCKTGAALPPPARQGNPHGVENRSFSRIVLADKYGRFTQFQIQ